MHVYVQAHHKQTFHFQLSTKGVEKSVQGVRGPWAVLKSPRCRQCYSGCISCAVSGSAAHISMHIPLQWYIFHHARYQIYGINSLPDGTHAGPQW